MLVTMLERNVTHMLASERDLHFIGDVMHIAKTASHCHIGDVARVPHEMNHEPECF